jgi:hypothetical protein
MNASPDSRTVTATSLSAPLALQRESQISIAARRMRSEKELLSETPMQDMGQTGGSDESAIGSC